MTTRLRLAAALCALVVSVIHLRGSQLAGRLGQDVYYDDVTYVSDAAARLEVGAADGLGAFLATFVREPPHSPFSTLLAVVGLTAFGFVDAAAYAANALVLVGTVLLLLHLFREERPRVRALIAFLHLTGAFAGATVTEFRPDLTLGMCTAAFVFTLLRGALLRRPSEVTLSGVLLGCALLVKPSFFGHTLAMAGAAGGIYLLLLARRREALVPLRVPLRALALGLLVALPHYVLNGRQIFGYFWTNTGGVEAYLWLFDGRLGLAQVAWRFLFDRAYGAVGFIGWDLHLFLAVVLGGAVLFAVRRMALELALVLALLAVGGVSILIVSLGRMDNNFFASTFQCLLTLAAYFTVGAVSRAVRPGAGAALGGLVAALQVLVALANRTPPWSPPPEVRPPTSWNDRVVAAVRADVQRRGVEEDRRDRVRLFVTAAGGVNGTSLRWACQKAGFQGTASDLHRSPSVEEVARAAREADYVIVPVPLQATILEWLPPARFQRPLLEGLRADPAFEPIPAGPPDEPARYLVLANRPRLAARGPVVDLAGLDLLEGFGPKEGPYPQWKLPRVRWLDGPVGRACFAGRPGGAALRARFRPAAEGTLSVTFQGAVVATREVHASEAFQELQVPLPGAGGRACLELAVRAPGGAPVARALLLQRLELAGP